MRVALASGLAFALLSPAAMAGEIDGELMKTPADEMGKIYLAWSKEIAPNTVEALTFRKSSYVSSYSGYVFDCATKTYAPLAGKRTTENGLAADKASVIKMATEALAKPYEMLPLVNDGLDALTFQIARHTCNNVLSIDIAAE